MRKALMPCACLHCPLCSLWSGGRGVDLTLALRKYLIKWLLGQHRLFGARSPHQDARTPRPRVKQHTCLPARHSAGRT